MARRLKVRFTTAGESQWQEFGTPDRIVPIVEKQRMMSACLPSACAFPVSQLRTSAHRMMLLTAKVGLAVSTNPGY